MNPTAPPPPTAKTPERRFARTKRVKTPKIFAAPFVPSSQPIGATQLALQESLTGNVVFANEGIANAIFEPSKVEDQIVVGILAGINEDKSLKAARDSVLGSKLAEAKKYKSEKYKSLVRRRILSSCGDAHVIPLAYAF